MNGVVHISIKEIFKAVRIEAKATLPWSIGTDGAYPPIEERNAFYENALRRAFGGTPEEMEQLRKENEAERKRVLSKIELDSNIEAPEAMGYPEIDP